MIKDKHDLVGKTFVAKESYPVYEEGYDFTEDDFFDFEKGEKILVKDFEADENHPEGAYLVWCLAWCDDGKAWVKLSEEEMLRALGLDN